MNCNFFWLKRNLLDDIALMSMRVQRVRSIAWGKTSQASRSMASETRSEYATGVYDRKAETSARHIMLNKRIRDGMVASTGNGQATVFAECSNFGRSADRVFVETADGNMVRMEALNETRRDDRMMLQLC